MVLSGFDEQEFNHTIEELGAEYKAIDYNAIGHGYCVNYHLKTSPAVLRKDTFHNDRNGY